MEALLQRTYDLINQTWTTFIHQVGNGILEINKEASMQLNYAYLLRNALPLIIFDKDEEVEIELERGIKINGRLRECDVIVSITKSEEKLHIPIEMKCYKKYASSGGLRGAKDIFYKDLYEDLELLEGYSQNEGYLNGIQLTMTDFRSIAFPTTKNGKYFDYDITDGHEINNGIELNTPIGGKEIDIKLKGSYQFKWQELNEFYFLKLHNNG